MQLSLSILEDPEAKQRHVGTAERGTAKGRHRGIGAADRASGMPQPSEEPNHD